MAGKRAGRGFSPTVKDVRYMEHRMAGKSPRAALIASDLPPSQYQISRLEKHIDLAKWFLEECETYEISLGLLVQKAREGLDAMAVKAFRSTVTEPVLDKAGEVVRDATGKPVMRTYDIIIDKFYPDYEVRFKYLQMLLEVLGLNARMGRSATTAPDDTSANGAGMSVNILQIGQDLGHMSEEDLREEMQKRLLGVMPAGTKFTKSGTVAPETKMHDGRDIQDIEAMRGDRLYTGEVTDAVIDAAIDIKLSKLPPE